MIPQTGAGIWKSFFFCYDGEHQTSSSLAQKTFIHAKFEPPSLANGSEDGDIGCGFDVQEFDRDRDTIESLRVVPENADINHS